MKENIPDYQILKMHTLYKHTQNTHLITSKKNERNKTIHTLKYYLSSKTKKCLVEKQLDKIPMQEQLQFCFSRKNKTIRVSAMGEKLCHSSLYSTTLGMKVKKIIFSKFHLEITLRYMIIKKQNKSMQKLDRKIMNYFVMEII